MPFQQSDQARILFQSSALPENTFGVARMEGEEGLSRPWRFDLTLVANRADLDLEAILAHPATLSLRGGAAATRYQGIVSGIEVVRQVGDITFYQMTLVPRFWRLGLYRITDVHTDEKTVPQIVEELLQSTGMLPGQDYEMRLSAPYRPRSFVCQYQESHRDFISRWLEHLGIYYWFENDGTREKIVFTDIRREETADHVGLVYRPAGQLDTTLLDDTLHAFTCRREPLPARVIVQGYNFRHSQQDIRAEANISAQGDGEILFTDENLRNNTEAQAIAHIRAEEIACRGQVFRGETACLSLKSGRHISVSGHFRSDFNQDLLLTEIHHRGSQAAILLAGIDESNGADAEEPLYRASFSAIPAPTQFRPPRLTPKPRIHGTMTAFIDAEGSGEYAELDPYGQYKVQLPWDLSDRREGRASAWIRLASPYAGLDHGMHLPLHKGAEVLLSFADGDPDRPVILSAVPNSENTNMVTQRNQTQSILHTAGDNRIAIEDQEGSKRIVLQTPQSNTWLRMGAPNDPPTGAPAAETPPSGGEKKESGGAEGFSLYTTSGYNCVTGSSSVEIGGNSTKVVVGAEQSVNVGSKFDLFAGAELGANVSQSLDLKYGTSAGYANSDNYEFVSGHHYQSASTSHTYATDYIHLGAGATDPVQVKLLAKTAAAFFGILMAERLTTDVGSDNTIATMVDAFLLNVPLFLSCLALSSATESAACPSTLDILPAAVNAKSPEISFTGETSIAAEAPEISLTATTAVKITADTASLNVLPGGINGVCSAGLKLECDENNSVFVAPMGLSLTGSEQVTVSAGATTVSLTSEGEMTLSAGPTTMSLGDAGATINGTLINLG